MPKDESSAGFASRSDMSPRVRRIQSRFLRVAAGAPLRDARRRAREARRRLLRAPHRVEYFHQVDDPYSQLAAQALAPLRERYEIEIVPHLVGPEVGPNLPEPELLASLAARDAARVAPHYGLAFPEKSTPAGREAVELALRIVARAGPPAFAEAAVRAGNLLLRGDRAALAAQPAVDLETARRAVARGDARRRRLGHYSGGMFYYEGEWYWGVDRLHHLEARLRALGAARPGSEMRFPRPGIPMEPVARGRDMTLEVFPSLRSPYTAIGFATSVALAQRTGVALVVRPVLPMVMRGVPATLRKGLYIFRDALREAESLGVAFGPFLDPIGEPVRRAYSLWPYAKARGRGAEYIANFLQAAFTEACPTFADEGLRRVVEGAGLSWDEARAHLGESAWEAELEANRRAMYDEMGLWGVPSFRLRGPRPEPDLCCWGQDRLWLVGREIQRRGNLR